MDRRTQEIVRAFKANPDDETLRARVEVAMRRLFVEPDDCFQADLQEGGRLERALMWEMEFSRVSVQAREQGGLISAASTFGHEWAHVRVWYPEFDDVMKDFLPEDIRITVQAGRLLEDTIESLEGRFPSATVVSANVARAEEDGRHWQGSYAKPKRRDAIDKRELARAEIPVRSTRHRGWGDNAWVA